MTLTYKKDIEKVVVDGRGVTIVTAYLLTT